MSFVQLFEMSICAVETITGDHALSVDITLAEGRSDPARVSKEVLAGAATTQRLTTMDALAPAPSH